MRFRANSPRFDSGQRLDDHFVDITEMIEIGKGSNLRSADSIKKLESKRRKQIGGSQGRPKIEG